MTPSKVLFEKACGAMSESEQCDEASDDVWDDSKLNNAYDKALRIANAEVAKRVAMSTNTTNTNSENREGNIKNAEVAKRVAMSANTTNTNSENREGLKTKKEKLPKPSSSKVSNKEEWKAGMACRAPYEEDGQEYEACVLRIINEKECIVRFLGYDNCEIVPISKLDVSLGKAERRQQIEQASLEKSEFPVIEDNDYLDGSIRAPSSGSTENTSQRRKKSPKNDLPFQMPNFSMMPNLAHLELPMPPPPPMAMPALADSEDQAVSSMLLSWYMSGYYTGLYQGMKRAKQGRGNV